MSDKKNRKQQAIQSRFFGQLTSNLPEVTRKALAAIFKDVPEIAADQFTLSFYCAMLGAAVSLTEAPVNFPAPPEIAALAKKHSINLDQIQTNLWEHKTRA